MQDRCWKCVQEKLFTPEFIVVFRLRQVANENTAVVQTILFKLPAAIFPRWFCQLPLQPIIQRCPLILNSDAKTKTTLECVRVSENQTFIFMRPFHKLCTTNTWQGNVSVRPFASSLQPYPSEIRYKDPHKTAWQILDGVDQSIMVRILLVHLPQTDPH